MKLYDFMIMKVFVLTVFVLTMQLVRALHRNRRATGSIPARGPIVVFFAAVPARANARARAKIPLNNFHLQNPSTLLVQSSPEILILVHM